MRRQIIERYLVRPRAADEGFLTSEGKFVGRHQAMKIAVGSGQIKKPAASTYEEGEDPEALHSEDLW